MVEKDAVFCRLYHRYVDYSGKLPLEFHTIKPYCHPNVLQQDVIGSSGDVCFLIGSYVRILHRAGYSFSFCTHPSFYSIVCLLKGRSEGEIPTEVERRKGGLLWRG